jgi:hypothetical protein
MAIVSGLLETLDLNNNVFVEVLITGNSQHLSSPSTSTLGRSSILNTQIPTWRFIYTDIEQVSLGL